MPSSGRVVVIEVSPSDRATMRRCLLQSAAHPIEIDEADTGEAGLALISRGRPSAVLLSQALPGMSGLEVLARLRAEHGVGLPVLVLASAAGEALAIEAIDGGAQDFLIKEELSPASLALALTKAMVRAAHEARQELARAAAEAALDRENQGDRRRIERDVQFLADAGHALAASLDLEATLRQIAQLTGAYLGNGCAIELLEDDGKLWRVTSFYTDQATPDAAPAPTPRWERDVRIANDPASVLRTGLSLHAPLADEAYYEVARLSPAHRARLEALGLHSYLQVALRGRERILGVLIIGLSAPGRSFTARDIAVAEEFGRSAGQAIENARLYRDAQAAVALREQIISVVSHDLRNPLNVIYSQGWILSKRAASTPEHEWLVRPLARIERSARKMTGIVSQLLDVAKLQAGRSLDLNLAPTDLVELVYSVVEELQASSERPSIRVLAAAAEIWGSWDRGRLEQVVVNLLGNAMKYSPPSVTIELNVLLEPGKAFGEGPTAVFTVRDQGIGIPAGDLAYVFDWFRRGSNVTGRVPGTGVGLASARMILAQHGGTIAVDSREGQGATFTVRLPVKPPSR